MPRKPCSLHPKNQQAMRKSESPGCSCTISASTGITHISYLYTRNTRKKNKKKS